MRTRLRVAAGIFSPSGCPTWWPNGPDGCSDTATLPDIALGLLIGSPWKDSIYVDPAQVGRGIGRALLSTLIERCCHLGYRQMVAVIGGSDQWPSIRLHEALGFTRAGILPAVGFKFDGWIDCVLMQRALGPGAATPPCEIGRFSKGDQLG